MAFIIIECDVNLERTSRGEFNYLGMESTRWLTSPSVYWE